ncbi:MAG: hypothetical protein KBG39_04515 [Opitutaceae bacterium]|nr:hypothetical protein [Opitutaceae bacterium]
MTTSKDTVPAEHYAAMCVAVGWLRGAISGALDGDMGKEQMRRVLDATATAEIAKALDKKEGDLFVDWNLYLTEAQKHRIGGDQ